MVLSQRADTLSGAAGTQHEQQRSDAGYPGDPDRECVVHSEHELRPAYKETTSGGV